MIRFVKSIIKRNYARKNNIEIHNISKISYNLIKQIGVGSKIKDVVSLVGKIEIGRYTTINGPGTRIASLINKIRIGSFCSIASNVIIQEYNHKYNRITSYYIFQNLFKSNNLNEIDSKGDINIGEDVWIGSNSVILSGINIGRGSIVGAGSVVVKDIPPYSIVVGNPAKVIKSRFTKECIDLLEEIKWWDWDIEKIKKNKNIFNMSEKEILINKNLFLSLKE